MNCTQCGSADAVVGTTCSSCGAVVVDPDVLDSLLSVPAEAVDDEPEDRDADLPRLTVEPGSVGASTEVDGERLAVTSFWDEPSLVDDPGPVGESAIRSALVGDDDGFHVPAVPSTAIPVKPVPVVPQSAPLPRRTPLAATEPQWGPRAHPPAVLAPPPPHPLDAPVVTRVKRPSGTGLPPGVGPGGPAPMPSVPRTPAPPPVPSSSVNPVPQRPTHPRVRRWFGRAADGEDVDDAGARAPVGPVEGEPDGGTLEGPFAGAPDGLLDGVVPEAQREGGVRDPAALDAATSRLSAGARRAALAPLAVVATLLEPGEVAEAVVQGEYQTRPAVVVLTDRRVVVANDRRWAPDARTFALGPHLAVHGWQDDRRATLVFVVDGVGVVVDAISDRPLARDLAQRVRGRCGGAPPGFDPAS